jgi:hypothetical protein
MAVRKVNGAASQYEVANFEDDSLYTGAAFVPEGDYALEGEFVMYRGRDGKRPEYLAVKVTFHPLGDPEGKDLEQFYSMGKKAHLSVRPHPENPKVLVRVPNGPAVTFNNSTNWFFFLHSLKSAQMPPGTLGSDISGMDGAWAHVQNIPEPAERADMKNNDLAEGESDAPAAGPRRPQMIPVVGFFLDGQTPWEGGGGLEDFSAYVPAGEAAPAGRAIAAASKPNGKAVIVPAKKPAAPPAEEATSEEAVDIAMLAIGEYVGKVPTGGTTVGLQSSVFKYVSAHHGDDKAQEVQVSCIKDAAVLADLLAAVGYEAKGVKIIPVAA